MNTQEIVKLLGESRASNLLEFKTPAISKDRLHKPSPNFIDDIWRDSNRSNQVLNSLAAIHNHGRLGGTGYVSILPV
ncbi:MAG: fructose-bisphosphate aldolase, partial [Bacteroidetes bacterium]|nr:fructose-bisphosphate aldolase [Bacteroidota bacterium]